MRFIGSVQSLSAFAVGSFIDHSQQLVHIHTVYSEGFHHGLTAGRGAAKAMHANGEEDRRRLGRDIKDITDNCIFGNFDHDFDLPVYLRIVYPKRAYISTEKYRKEMQASPHFYVKRD